MKKSFNVGLRIITKKLKQLKYLYIENVKIVKEKTIKGKPFLCK